MRKEGTTTIQVTTTFRNKIKELKRSGESYEAYFERIIKEKEYLEKIVQAIEEK